jgi:5-methylcytosine-specific restriction endonuclease McrA
MPMRKGAYPDNWDAIALAVKKAADWRCQDCGMQCRRPGEAFDTHKRTMSVHHMGAPLQENCAMKPCSTCGTIHALSEFPISPKMKDGRLNRCKECQNARQRAYYASGFREKALAATKKWREEHPDQVATRHVAWRLANKDRRREKARPAMRLWKERNKNLVRAHQQANKARRRIGTRDDAFSGAEWMVLCSEYDFQCACCQQKGNLTPDHIVPLSRGGCNHIHNIQPLCMYCNLKKGTQVIYYRSMHDKMDCRPENLIALCSACHLARDLPGHILNAARTRRAKLIGTGQAELEIEV